MPDNLLYLFSTIASLSAVLALALVIDVRNDVKRWMTGDYKRWTRAVEAVFHIIVVISLSTALMVSLVALLGNMDDFGLAQLATNAVSLGFGMLVLGVVFGQVAVGFVRKPENLA